MGKFKVNRLACRVPDRARGGSDDRFCCKRDEEREREERDGSEADSGLVEDSTEGEVEPIWDAFGGPWMRASPVPGLSIADQPTGDQGKVKTKSENTDSIEREGRMSHEKGYVQDQI